MAAPKPLGSLLELALALLRRAELPPDVEGESDAGDAEEPAHEEGGDVGHLGNTEAVQRAVRELVVAKLGAHVRVIGEREITHGQIAERVALGENAGPGLREEGLDGDVGEDDRAHQAALAAERGFSAHQLALMPSFSSRSLVTRPGSRVRVTRELITDWATSVSAWMSAWVFVFSTAHRATHARVFLTSGSRGFLMRTERLMPRVAY
jgi:hypothetical protein